MKPFLITDRPSLPSYLSNYSIYKQHFLKETTKRCPLKAVSIRNTSERNANVPKRTYGYSVLKM